SSGWTRSGRPTTTTSTPYSRAAWPAPLMICSGALSPPMASTAMRVGGLGRDSAVSLDVEVAHCLRMRLDELATRLDVAAHQLLEDLVDLRDVLDLDLEQRARRRVHGRVPELVGVHLAQTLEAADLDLAAHALDLA